VYGGTAVPATFASKRLARKMMRRYARVGIQASLYAAAEDGVWVLVERRDANGQPYRQFDDPPPVAVRGKVVHLLSGLRKRGG
jgi:hypothetical protein